MFEWIVQNHEVVRDIPSLPHLRQIVKDRNERPSLCQCPLLSLTSRSPRINSKFAA